MRRYRLTLPVLFAVLGFLVTYAPTAAHAKTCATINNTTNTASWVTDRGKVQRATYADNGDALTYNRPVPRAVLLAEAKLALGDPGPKIARACTPR